MLNSVVKVRVKVEASYSLPPLSGESPESMFRLEQAYLGDELRALFPPDAVVEFTLQKEG